MCFLVQNIKKGGKTPKDIHDSCFEVIFSLSSYPSLLSDLYLTFSFILSLTGLHTFYKVAYIKKKHCKFLSILVYIKNEHWYVHLPNHNICSVSNIWHSISHCITDHHFCAGNESRLMTSNPAKRTTSHSHSTFTHEPQILL